MQSVTIRFPESITGIGVTFQPWLLLITEPGAIAFFLLLIIYHCKYKTRKWTYTLEKNQKPWFHMLYTHTSYCSALKHTHTDVHSHTQCTHTQGRDMSLCLTDRQSRLASLAIGKLWWLKHFRRSFSSCFSPKSWEEQKSTENNVMNPRLRKWTQYHSLQQNWGPSSSC